jgi:prepilin-type processing-associated H-X9-DG protein
LNRMSANSKKGAMTTATLSADEAAGLAKLGESEFVGEFGSRHPGGGNFVFGDGSVRFLSEKIRAPIYRSLGNRADGNLISDTSTDLGSRPVRPDDSVSGRHFDKWWLRRQTASVRMVARALRPSGSRK